MRLDKFLCDMNLGTRSQVKDDIRKGLVTVNGAVQKKADCKIDENNDEICYRGERCSYQKYAYYMLHKPTGVVSATRDNTAPTVLSLLKGVTDKELFPVGRLDKDTEGLLLITNDGELSHQLLSPKKHVDKTYLVHVQSPLTVEDVSRLEKGVDIGDDKPTLPAKAQLLSEKELLLTIHEGRFHQVKRMLQAVNNEVVYLKRLAFGGLKLDEALAPGQFRALTAEELTQLKQTKKPMLQEVEAVIFDLDGTLVDSMWMWKSIDIEYLARFGISLPENLQSEIQGMSFSETAVYFKERFQIPDSLEQMKADWNQMAWDKYMYEVPLKEGVYEFLCGCKERGIRLGIATSNSRELVENIAEVHRLHDFFDCIMTACEVAKGKPAPDIYLAVAGKLGVEPSKCLVFEDIVPGIMAGRDAGMRVCGVEDAYSADYREKKQELADYYIDSYVGLWNTAKEGQR